MSRVLLDENVPVAIRHSLPGHDVTSLDDQGWKGLSNGELVARAKNEGFDVLLTCDQNLRYQQNLQGRRLALVILSTNHWMSIRGSVDRVAEAIDGAKGGSYREIDIPYSRGRSRERER